MTDQQQTDVTDTAATVVRETAGSLARDGVSVDDVQFATPEHEQAWREFYSHPATRAAQAAFDDRKEQLEPLRRVYRMLDEQAAQLRTEYAEKITAAQLVFQGQAHTAMFALTKRIAELDAATFGVDVLSGH